MYNGSTVNTFQIPYDDSADQFERGRALSKVKEDLWLELFEKHLDLRPSSRVLDIGCGTGRFSILISKRFGCRVNGIDPSISMLAKAKAKCHHEIGWSQGYGEAVPFGDGTFNVCLASQVIQHFQNKAQAFTEMRRVLCPGGKAGIRLSSHAQLKTILDYRFFPSGLQAELERLPDIHTVRNMLLTAGFGGLEEYIVRQPLFESACDYLDKLRNRYASFLYLISEEEYQKGLIKAAEYLRDYSFSRDKYAEITFLVGINGYPNR